MQQCIKNLIVKPITNYIDHDEMSIFLVKNDL